MRVHGLEGKIHAKAVRQVVTAAGDAVAGIYKRTRGRIEVSADAGAGPIGVLHHEIIHALRDSTLWGTPYGLFTKGEWQAMVRKARADKVIMERIDSLYPDLSTGAKMEEAVAELYRVTRRQGRAGHGDRADRAVLRGAGQRPRGPRLQQRGQRHAFDCRRRCGRARAG